MGFVVYSQSRLVLINHDCYSMSINRNYEESILVMTKSNSIASRLISRRAEIGMSQNQLAVKAEIAPAQVSRYESGASNPSIKTLGKLAVALGVNFDWLQSGSDPKTPPQEEFYSFFGNDDDGVFLKSLKALAEENGMTLNDVLYELMGYQVAQRKNKN